MTIPMVRMIVDVMVVVDIYPFSYSPSQISSTPQSSHAYSSQYQTQAIVHLSTYSNSHLMFSYESPTSLLPVPTYTVSCHSHQSSRSISSTYSLNIKPIQLFFPCVWVCSVVMIFSDSLGYCFDGITSWIWVW